MVVISRPSTSSLQSKVCFIEGYFSRPGQNHSGVARLHCLHPRVVAVMVEIQIKCRTEVAGICHGLKLSVMKSHFDVIYIGKLHYRSDGNLAGLCG